MTSFEEKASGRLPALKSFAEKMCALATEVLDGLSTTNEDNFGIMGMWFLSKQRDHLDAIILLEYHRDSELIARSMLEGLVQLVWAGKDPDNRACQWREFGRIHNYWTLLEERRVLNNRDVKFEDGIRRNAEALTHFYSDQAKKAKAKGQPLPRDPFVKNWTTLRSIKKVFEAVETDKGLYKMYSRFSDWHHWNFAGMSRALDLGEVVIRYKSDSGLSSAQAMVTGFQSLFQTCDLVDQHFRLGMGEKLNSLQDEYLQNHKPLSE